MGLPKWKCPWCPTFIPRRPFSEVYDEGIWGHHASSTHPERRRAEPDVEPLRWEVRPKPRERPDIPGQGVLFNTETRED